VAINQTKLYSLIAVKGESLFTNDSQSDALLCQLFKCHLVDTVVPYLKEKFSVFLKKEVLNLISLIAHFSWMKVEQIKELPEQPESVQLEEYFLVVDKESNVIDRLMGSLNYMRQMHFPIRSRELLDKSSNNE